MMPRNLSHACFVGALLLAPAAMAEDQTLSLSVGYDQSSGKYGGTETTDIRFVPFTVQWESDHLTLKASTAWLEIDGPGSLIGDGEVVPGATTGSSGMGDTNLSAAWLFYPFVEGGPFIEVGGKVKVPTADETKGLGSGEVDYTLMSSLFQVMGPVTLFGDAGYRFRGSSDLYTLEDGFVGSLGGSFKVNDQAATGLVLSYRQAATPTGDDPMDLTPYLTLKPIEDWSVNLYGSIGLSDASPDSGFGLSVKRKFSY